METQRRRAPCFLGAALVLVLTSCGEPAPPTGEAVLAPQEPPEAVELESSGRTLSGRYTLTTSSPPVVSARIDFTDDGEYTRAISLAGGGAELEEAGTYVVDRQERLVLWVEREGERRYSAARPVFFGLRGDPASEIELVASDGRVERYSRTGDAPKGPAREF
jgi:hypothetical protein